MKQIINTSGKFSGLLFLLIFFFTNQQLCAQKVLNEQETAIVLEAKAELQEAITNPDLPQSERMRIVERSAKTLKEYGQPPEFPEGDIPLKILMKNNYGQAEKQYNDVNGLRQKLNSMNLDAKMKFINALQIEVVEEQVKLILPGSELEYDLALDLVGTVFGWNITQGFNQGEVDDANDLVKLFRKSAETNKLSGQLDELFKDHQFNMQELHRDLNMVGPLEAQLRKKYEMAAASVFTIKGYEGALLAGSNTNSPIVAEPVLNLSLDPSLIGTWLHTDNNRRQSGWQYNSDGTAVQYIRSERIPGWKWEVKGGMLYIIGGNGKSEDYNYRFENGALYMEVTLLGKQVWSAPMLKQ